MRTKVNYYNNYKYELYRFCFKMMETAFGSEDIMVGVRNALFEAKMFTESSDVLLYRKNDNDDYDLCLNSLMVKNNYKNDNNWINMFVNKSKHLFENKIITSVDCSDISFDRNLALIPIVIDDVKYLLAIINCNIYNEDKYSEFIKKFIDTMRIILKKLEEYKRLQEDSFKDKLTHIKNRNAYESDIKVLEEDDDNYIYVLLDLFRLKYINDNYDHEHGDVYIIKTAEILNKYFKEFNKYKDEHGVTREKPTGSCVYRIGGDEFVIIAKRESLDEVKDKLDLIRNEVPNIDLGVEENLYLAINYGIGVRENNESLSAVTKRASDELKQDKSEMYKRLGIERRKQIVKVK